METEKSKLRRETSYATRYSSDEDLSQSDNNKGSATKKRAGLARSTIAAISQPSGRNSRSGLSRAGISTTSIATMPPPSPKRAQPLANWSPPSKISSVYVSPLIQSGSSDSNDESDTNVDSPHSSYSSRYSANVSNSGLSPRSSVAGSSFNSFNGGDSGGDSGSPSRFSAFGRGLRNRFYGSGADEADTMGPTSNLHDPNIGSPKSTNGVYNGDEAASDFTKRLMSFRNRNLGGDSTGLATGMSASTNTHLTSGMSNKHSFMTPSEWIFTFHFYFVLQPSG